MWKPVLSAANHVRIFFMPPNGRTAMCPSGCRLQGQPQCSSRSNSSRRFFDESFDRVLIAEPVAAGDRVVGVFVQAVVGGNRAGGAPFGRDGVAPHRIHLRHDGHVQARIRLCDRDGRAQTCPSASNEHDVVRRRHSTTTSARLLGGE